MAVDLVGMSLLVTPDSRRAAKNSTTEVTAIQSSQTNIVTKMIEIKAATAAMSPNQPIQRGSARVARTVIENAKIIAASAAVPVAWAM